METPLEIVKNCFSFVFSAVDNLAWFLFVCLFCLSCYACLRLTSFQHFEIWASNIPRWMLNITFCFESASLVIMLLWPNSFLRAVKIIFKAICIFPAFSHSVYPALPFVVLFACVAFFVLFCFVFLHPLLCVLGSVDKAWWICLS